MYLTQSDYNEMGLAKLYVDRRLGGVDRWSLGKPADYDMRVTDHILNTVCFLAVKAARALDQPAEAAAPRSHAVRETGAALPRDADAGSDLALALTAPLARSRRGSAGGTLTARDYRRDGRTRG